MPNSNALHNAALVFALAPLQRSRDADIELEQSALRFAASRIRASGELGSERMASYVEDLIFDLRDDR